VFYEVDQIMSGHLTDIDGDGVPDLVLAGPYGEFTALYGNGDGGFFPPRTWGGMPNLTPPGGWNHPVNDRFGQKMEGIAAVPVRRSTDPTERLGVVYTAKQGDGAFGTHHATVGVVDQNANRTFRSAEATPYLRVTNTIGWQQGGAFRQQPQPLLQHLVDWDGDGRDDILVLMNAPLPDGNEHALTMRRGQPFGFAAAEAIGNVPAQCTSTTGDIRCQRWPTSMVTANST
jgi:hypothetical protein